MRCRFWLVDLNEGVWEGKPCIRLWGVDESNRRVIVVATQIRPYFYLLPSIDAESAAKRLESERQRFSDITGVSIEKRKLLGKEKAVLRIECLQTGSVSDYARRLPEVLGGTSFDDLRLATRYATDLRLTTCGWNECEVDTASFDNVTADQKYVARTLPVGVGPEAPPKLRMLAFSVLVVGQRGSAVPQRDAIRALAVATDSGASIVSASGNDDSDVLSSLIRTIDEFDPDVIVGYETNNWQWRYLVHRAKMNSKKLTIGRDRSEPHTSVFGHVSIAGRANVDLADLGSGIPQIKLKNLRNLAEYFKLPIANNLQMRDEWERFALWMNATRREELLENLQLSAQVALKLAQATFDYPVQLSAVTGLPLDQVMAAGPGFRVDSYFLRVAHQLGEVIPNKNELPFLTYRGALVQEPAIGIHRNLVVLDFASMYPSLMRKYNLSPDTLVGPDDHASPDSVYLIPEVGHRFLRQPDGFYRVALSSLIEERARIKNELASSDGKALSRTLRERERAVKVITNACYGYAGWVGARWYVREVAESAAALGRQLITETITKAKMLGLEVIYSDTDSIFVSNVNQKVKELIEWVNKDPELEIKVDAEYDRVLFTEAMKRYAGLRHDGTLDIVGLEVVRGDWTEIARSVQERVVRAILERESTTIAIEVVRETVRRLRNQEVPMKSYVIWKTLTKPIEKYRVRTPHAEVARILAQEGWHVTVGDKVAYVIVKGRGALFQRAKPYHTVRPEDLDVDYYVENQVKPAAMRILEGFGVNESQLGI